MLEIQTSLIINASPKKVWEALTDYPRYKEWSTFLQDIQGEPKEGSTLKVTICPPGAKPMPFSPTLTKVQSEQEVRWVGKFLCRHVFQGEHYFQLKKVSENETQFIHSEIFSGLLAPLFKYCFLKNTKNGFELFNQQLKERAEKRE